MRKLFLLSENQTETINQTLQILHNNHADLIILSANPDLYLAKPLHHAKGLLGNTLNAIVLDCRQGFPLDYFLCAANTIKNNGFFIIIDNIDHPTIDEQSNRFHTEAIPTHNFRTVLSNSLMKYSESYDHLLNLNHLPNITSSISNININTEQVIVLTELNKQTNGIVTLFAPRGTGKSFVVNNFLSTLNNDYIITAPNQTALRSYTIDSLNFKAPDDLMLNTSAQIDQTWLIIEEAAQMPISHLEKLSKLANKVLLISSIENYEGTGKGLESKLADIIPIQTSLTLSQHQRFINSDPLAEFCQAISFQTVESPIINDGITLYPPNSLLPFQSNTKLVQAFYQFMNQHHYQTNVQDVRRLLDSPNQLFITEAQNQNIIGGLWALHEGELSEELSQAVFNGYRRPKGNLVVQTLAAHSYYPELMILKSLRISRIAVDHAHRHKGIAKSMLNQLLRYAKEHHYDFLSTSFGLTEPLLQFWQQCGFTWIHLGSHRDKTTGLHSAILILPISEEMKEKLPIMQKKWFSDAFYLKDAEFIHQNIKNTIEKQGVNQHYDSLDQMVLDANLHHKKPDLSVYSAKKRVPTTLD